MRAHVFICCQPRPNSPQSSRCAFSRPIFVSVSRVHSLAFFAFGETGEARADAVHQRRGKFHDVRVVQAFVANALVHRHVERFGGGLNFSVGIDGGGRRRAGLGLSAA